MDQSLKFVPNWGTTDVNSNYFSYDLHCDYSGPSLDSSVIFSIFISFIRNKQRHREEQLQAPLKSSHMSNYSRPQVFHQTILIQTPPAMSNISAVVTPVELNKNLLNTLFKFRSLSKLKRFLVMKTEVEKTYYTLSEVSFLTNINFFHSNFCSF